MNIVNSTELEGRMYMLKESSQTRRQSDSVYFALRLNHTSSDLTISFFINSHLAWLPPTHPLSSPRRLSKPILQQRHTVTLSGRLNVWITVSRARQAILAMCRDGITCLFEQCHSRGRFKTSRSWSVCEQGINLLWHSLRTPGAGKRSNGASRGLSNSERQRKLLRMEGWR